MKKINFLLIGLMVVFSVESCQTQRFMLVKGAKVNEEKPTSTESQPFFVRGIGQKATTDIADSCSGKTPVAVDMQYTIVDGLLMYITGSIYSPRTLKVYCQ